MINDFIDSSFVYAVTFIVASTVLIIVCLDRYLTRRRSSARNVAYLTKARSRARTANVWEHHYWNQNVSSQESADLRSVLDRTLAMGGSLNRRQVLRDGFGRVIATHEEEISLANRTFERKMLVA